MKDKTTEVCGIGYSVGTSKPMQTKHLNTSKVRSWRNIHFRKSWPILAVFWSCTIRVGSMINRMATVEAEIVIHLQWKSAVIFTIKVVLRHKGKGSGIFWAKRSTSHSTRKYHRGEMQSHEKCLIKPTKFKLTPAMVAAAAAAAAIKITENWRAFHRTMPTMADRWDYGTRRGRRPTSP